MPTLSLPDGASLSWDSTPTAPEAAPVVAPLAVSAPEPDPAPEPIAAPEPSEADVDAALRKAPPKWVASAMRFAKAFTASLAVSFALYGGDVSKMIHDPVGVITAFGTAAVLAVEKFLKWKD